MDSLAHSQLLGQMAQKLTLPLEQPLFYQTRSHCRLQLPFLEIHEPSAMVSKWICQED